MIDDIVSLFYYFFIFSPSAALTSSLFIPPFCIFATKVDTLDLPRFLHDCVFAERTGTLWHYLFVQKPSDLTVAPSRALDREVLFFSFYRRF